MNLGKHTTVGGYTKTNLLIAVVGPTASGKSTLAINGALALNGEIVNCDSMQMYRRLSIGTAKPTADDRRKVPHHLYDTIEPDQHYSAGRYMKEARDVCRQIRSRGHIPFVVGGTGLYLRALLNGMFEGPGRAENIRCRLHKIASRKGAAVLYRILENRDPLAATKIRSGDERRIVRALEVYLETGHPMSQLQGKEEALKDFPILKVGLDLPRSDLYDRIGQRVSWMFDSGLLDEVEQLLVEGYTAKCKAFEALGYRHALDVLSGKLGREEAVELTQRDTRRYAKRQLTWFRRETNMEWISGPGECPDSLDRLLELVARQDPQSSLGNG